MLLVKFTGFYQMLLITGWPNTTLSFGPVLLSHVLRVQVNMLRVLGEIIRGIDKGLATDEDRQYHWLGILARVSKTNKPNIIIISGLQPLNNFFY